MDSRPRCCDSSLFSTLTLVPLNLCSQPKMPRTSTSRKRSSSGLRARNQNSDEEDKSPVKKGSLPDQDDDDDDEETEFQFTQQAPEMSQPINPVRQSEKSNLEKMGDTNRQNVIRDLSRNILFKALAGEPIDRLKCAKECNLSDQKITSAVYDEAASNLRNVFGFELRRVPKFMEKRKSLPSKYKDRLFVINNVADDERGTHSKAIHSVHSESAVERGLLMLILAFAFCKGEPRQDKSRWITDVDLYRLLHGVDDNIPEEPPSVANRKTVATAARSRTDGDGGVAQTPDVDTLLVQFVERDYLLREKCTETTGLPTATSQVTDQDSFQYSMGPRAAMEIGRRQIIFFCSEILDEGEPDPTMLEEIDDEDAEDNEGAYTDAN